MDDAARAPGWLREIRGEHVPETEEYGVSSFVFRADRPFHQARLNFILDSPLVSAGPLAPVLKEAASKKEGGAAKESAKDTAEGPAEGEAKDAAGVAGDKAEEKDEAEGDEDEDKEAEVGVVPDEVAAVCRGEHGVVVRSKGVAWLSGAVGDECFGEWSHSGRLVGLVPAGRWADAEDGAEKQTEVVVIGISMDAKLVEAALRWAVVTPEELAKSATEPLPEPIWGELSLEEMEEVFGDDHDHGEDGDEEEGEEGAEEGAEEAEDGGAAAAAEESSAVAAASRDSKRARAA